MDALRKKKIASVNLSHAVFSLVDTRFGNADLGLAARVAQSSSGLDM